MHVCTVCHPRNFLSPSKAEMHRTRTHALSGCCLGCACGWWRGTEQEAEGEAILAAAEARKTEAVSRLARMRARGS
jgi:hypothetical protein